MTLKYRKPLIHKNQEGMHITLKCLDIAMKKSWTCPQEAYTLIGENWLHLDD